jgi:hypothetical protein
MRRQGAALAAAGALCLALVCCLAFWGGEKNLGRRNRSELFEVASNSSLSERWGEAIKRIEDTYESRISNIRLATSAKMRKVNGCQKYYRLFLVTIGTPASEWMRERLGHAQDYMS